MHKVECPHCDQWVTVRSQTNMAITCTHCRGTFRTRFIQVVAEPITPSIKESNNVIRDSSNIAMDEVANASDGYDQYGPNLLACISTTIAISFAMILCAMLVAWNGVVLCGAIVLSFYVFHNILGNIQFTKSDSTDSLCISLLSLLVPVVAYAISVGMHPDLPIQHEYPESVVNDVEAEQVPASRYYPNIESPNRDTGTDDARQELPAIPVQSLPRVALPRTGLTDSFTTSLKPARLTIKTPYSDNHYFIKLVDVSNDNAVLTAFIRAGESLTLGVPIGSFELRLATGIQWFGEAYLFGKSTSYFQTDEVHQFTQQVMENVISTSHITISLTKVLNGNLDTNEISPNDW